MKTEAREIHIRIPKDLKHKLTVAASEGNVAEKSLIISALEDLLGGKAQEESEALRKELSQLSRRMSALRGDVEILGELLSYFIFHWLGYTPRLNKAERASLAIEAKERHEKFMAMFARKLAKGDLTLSPVLVRGVQSEEEDIDTSE